MTVVGVTLMQTRTSMFQEERRVAALVSGQAAAVNTAREGQEGWLKLEVVRDGVREPVVTPLLSSPCRIPEPFLMSHDFEQADVYLRHQVGVLSYPILQGEQIMSTTSSSTPATTYCPPSHDVLEHFAFSACEELGPEFDDPEVARGFADFLTAVARIKANNLNRKGHSEFAPRAD